MNLGPEQLFRLVGVGLRNFHEPEEDQPQPVLSTNYAYTLRLDLLFGYWSSANNPYFSSIKSEIESAYNDRSNCEDGDRILIISVSTVAPSA